MPEREDWIEALNQGVDRFRAVRDEQKENPDLSGADLSGRDLRDAPLDRANLSGADLRNADLRGHPGLHGSHQRRPTWREAGQRHVAPNDAGRVRLPWL